MELSSLTNRGLMDNDESRILEPDDVFDGRPLVEAKFRTA